MIRILNSGDLDQMWSTLGPSEDERKGGRKACQYVCSAKRLKGKKLTTYYEQEARWFVPSESDPSLRRSGVTAGKNIREDIR